ncbi:MULTISPECIES: hypothetical protein [unclassified Chamaesiphon]|uniref:hypothetical protein n=1 Tax=unclassified Chamaesiphon TaxID=2620921 RepID=UPI00286BC203|nr:MULTISPECIES: hypothetical protein [unclassified Chamaesiphon]
MHDRLERIESIKAGSLGGIAAGIFDGITMLVDRSLWLSHPKSLLSLGVEVAIAIVSGFLFGVTYRYIIRTDRNHHLNSGAVLAFGLVRGLAHIDVDAFSLSQVWIDGLSVGESVVMFAIARYTLDYALAASWVLSFTQQSQSESLDIGSAASTLR